MEIHLERKKLEERLNAITMVRTYDPVQKSLNLPASGTLTGTKAMCERFLPLLAKSKDGRIIKYSIQFGTESLLTCEQCLQPCWCAEPAFSKPSRACLDALKGR